MIEDPEAPHVHHGGSGIKWLDLALALAVIVLSAASLITAQHTGKTMEKLVDENSRLVRANATPLLQLQTSNVVDQKRVIEFDVSNVGTGTARIIWFEIVDNGKPLRNAFELLHYQPRAADSDYVTTAMIPDTYLPAGDSRAIVRWPYPATAESRAAWEDINVRRFKLVASACFCSVLGECWTSHLKADAPVPVKSCDARGNINFKG